MVHDPPSASIRSRIPFKPKCSRSRSRDSAASGSNPRPSSRMLKVTRPSITWREISARIAPACLTTLVSASWATRYRLRWRRGESVAKSPRTLTSSCNSFGRQKWPQAVERVDDAEQALRDCVVNLAGEADALLLHGQALRAIDAQHRRAHGDSRLAGDGLQRLKACRIFALGGIHQQHTHRVLAQQHWENVVGRRTQVSVDELVRRANVPRRQSRLDR